MRGGGEKGSFFSFLLSFGHIERRTIAFFFFLRLKARLSHFSNFKSYPVSKPLMSGIDYSKWDRLECSSSSSSSSGGSDEEPRPNDEHTSSGDRGAPKVTRLEYPTHITLGPSGVQLGKAPPKASATPFHPSVSQRQVPQLETSVQNAELTTGFTSSSTSPRDATQQLHSNEEGADAADEDEDLLYESLARNGGREGTEHWWSQTEDSATVSFLVPWETTAKMVTRFNLHEVRDDTTGQHHAQLDVLIHTPAHSSTAVPLNVENADATFSPSSGGVVHLCKRFRYPIKLSEELVEGCWQLHRMPHRHVRLLVVEVFKEAIGQGMTLWWDRCFVSDSVAVIDTQKIPDRVQTAAAGGTAAQTKAEQFRQVWDDAHEEFRRRMRERKAKQL